MTNPDRRDFLLVSTAAAAASLTATPEILASNEPASPRGKAEHCIYIWLGGGAGQIDTWDPKELGDPKAKKAGSYYPAVETAIPGEKVCQHLARCAKVLDRFILVRTVHHEVIDEHAAAANRMHTGRPTSGTIIYPSIGSIVAHQRGAAGEGVPAYVLIGYPNVTRGPGFLGSKHGYVYLTDTTSSPAGFARPPEISDERQARREALLSQVREDYLVRQNGDSLVQQYDATISEALRLSGPNFKRI